MTEIQKAYLLGRFDNYEIGSHFKEESYCKANNRDLLFVMDNASIHIATEVKEKLLKSYNIMFLPPYSPFLNIIELWYS